MSRSLLLGASIIAALTSACGDDGTGAGGDDTTTASTGASSGTPATSTTATSTTATTASASVSASASDSASSTSSGMMVCVPGAQEPCYSGPAGTDGVGTCVAGIATCLPDGSGLGVCEGEVTPSFESCAFDANCDGTAAPPCDVLYQNQYVAPGDDFISAVAIDPAGNVFFAGSFQSSITFNATALSGAGSYNVFLAKADPTGNVLWAKSLPGNDRALAQGLATDPDGNVVLLGRFTGEIDCGGGPVSVGIDESSFVAKYDASGNHVFSHVYNDLAYPPVWSVAVDGTGAVLFGGFFTAPIDFGGGVMTSAGLDDAFLVKLDADGNFVWSKQLGDASGQAIFGVAVDGNDNVYATGTFLGTIDFGLGVRTAVDADVFVVALDATGVPLWDFVGGGAGQQYADRIVADSGEVVVAATFESSIDVGGGPLVAAPLALFKLDAAGAHRWSKAFAGPIGSTFTTNLAIGPHDDVFWTGRYSATMDFGGAPVPNNGAYDTWLAHFDESGVHRSSQGFGLDAWQTCDGLAIDAAGRAVLGCGNEGRVDFGAGVLQAVSPSDAVLASVLVP